MSFFQAIVLPSVELPNKPTYTIKETLTIIGCSRTTLYRKIHRGELTLTPDKRIYKQDLENYFGRCSERDCKKDKSET